MSILRSGRASFASLGLVSLAVFARCGGGAAGFSVDGGLESGAGVLDGQAPQTGDARLTTGDASQGSSGPCVNLECRQRACSGGSSTSVTGAVYDPAGKNPLYNVVVYVPNSPVQAIASGASCNSCNSLYTGDPLVATTTSANGTFELTNVPVGDDIPLVVQVGKWRTQTTINVKACTTNELEKGALRLPSNHTLPGANLPQIAISTGGADTLECLLRRMGIDAAEYTPGPHGDGHIHIFQGSGEVLGEATSPAPTTSTPAPTSATSLWDQDADLSPYDMLLLSCEGQETTDMNQGVLYDYTAKGGRVFASHYHYAWFDSGPFGTENLAEWTVDEKAPLTGNQELISANVVTAPNGRPFPKGLALETWLLTVGALTYGELPIQEPRYDAVVSVANTPSQAWLTSDNGSGDPGATEYFSFNTEVGLPADQQCGRVVFSDIHVGAASNDYANGVLTVPDGCATGDLSPQEKALEFMLFDLSSCVTPDYEPPPPPPSSAGPK